MPDGVVIRESEHARLPFVDEAKGLVWQVHFGDLALALDAAHDPSLLHDADHTARVIYALTERAIEVVRPPIARASGAPPLPASGASFTPPPHFALAGDDARDTLLFTRVSLANTDGVWRMAVAREDPDAVTARRPLRQRVESPIARRFGIEHIDDARVTLTHTNDGIARVHVRFDAREAQCALASTWWLHGDQGLRGVQVSATTGVSLADAIAVVDEAVASWRVGALDGVCAIERATFARHVNVLQLQQRQHAHRDGIMQQRVQRLNVFVMRPGRWRIRCVSVSLPLKHVVGRLKVIDGATLKQPGAPRQSTHAAT